nr:dTMP kinase [Wielerella bovis]
MIQPKFLTLDGIDGAGKTTQLNVIRAWFEARGLPVLFTREPGGTPLGERLREILLAPETQVSLRTETLMMFAARCQHLEDVILPALKNGVNVVSDRFTDATFAYQGGGRGLPDADIAVLERWVQGSLKPDLTILLDVPLEVSLARIESSRKKDRFEQEQADFFRRVRDVYLQRAAAAPEHYVVVNSNREKADVKVEIETVLDKLFQAA